MERWIRKVILIAIIGSFPFLAFLEGAEVFTGTYRPSEYLEEEMIFYPQDFDLMSKMARKEGERGVIKLFEGLEEEVKKYSPEKTAKRFVARYEYSRYRIRIDFEDGTSAIYEDWVSDYFYRADTFRSYVEIAQQKIGVTLSSYSKKYFSYAYTGEGKVDIRLKIRVFNYTDRDIFFTFISNQRFEVIIEDEDGEEVWRFSQGKHFWIYPRGRFDVERIPAKGEKVYEVHIKSFKLGNFKVRVKYLSQEPLKEAETRFTVQYMSPDYDNYY